MAFPNVVAIADRAAFSAEKMQKNPVFDAEHFFLDAYCFEPGQEQKPHTHDGADKVYMVLEGEGEFIIGDETMTVGPGHAILAPSGVVHGVVNRSEQRLVTLAFMAPNPNRGDRVTGLTG